MPRNSSVLANRAEEKSSYTKQPGRRKIKVIIKQKMIFNDSLKQITKYHADLKTKPYDIFIMYKVKIHNKWIRKIVKNISIEKKCEHKLTEFRNSHNMVI